MSKDIKIGEFQKFNHPNNAEKHTLSDYTKYAKVFKYSKLSMREVTCSKSIFHCPRCGKASNNKQEHGDAYKCGGCGLKRQSFGNALYVWDDKNIK